MGRTQGLSYGTSGKLLRKQPGEMRFFLLNNVHVDGGHNDEQNQGEHYVCAHDSESENKKKRSKIQRIARPRV